MSGTCKKKSNRCSFSKSEKKLFRNITVTGAGLYAGLSALLVGVFKIAPQPSYKALRRANASAALAHLISGITMVYFARTDKADWRFRVNRQVRSKPSVRLRKIEDDSKRIRSLFAESTELKEMLSVRLGYSTATFSFLTVLAHLTLIFLGTSYGGYKYNKWIDSRRNPLRWFEYFITSSIMVTNLAGLSGFEDMWMLLGIFILTAVTNLFGYGIETSRRNIDKSVLMFAGFVAFVLPWYMILFRFNESISFFLSPDVQRLIFNGKDKVSFGNREVKAGSFKPPDFVKYVLIVIAGLYLIFPAVQTAQIIVPGKYRTGEFSFLLSSLICKIVLNGMIFSGARREDDTPRDCESISRCDEAKEFSDLLKQEKKRKINVIGKKVCKYIDYL